MSNLSIPTMMIIDCNQFVKNKKNESWPVSCQLILVEIEVQLFAQKNAEKQLILEWRK